MLKLKSYHFCPNRINYITWCHGCQTLKFQLKENIKVDIELKYFYIMIRSKFRGSLAGVLIGDCCGSPFKGQEIIEGGEKLVLRKYFDTLEGVFFKGM